MSKIHYMVGDATLPKIEPEEISVITHCCNTVGAWGTDFSDTLGKRYPIAKLAYTSKIEANKKINGNLLGKVDFINIDESVDVANLFGESSVKPDNSSLNYNALECGFGNIIKYYKEKGKSFTIHIPRIGCSLAGGNWVKVEEIIERRFIKEGIDVFVYDLPLKTDAVTYRNIDKEIENEIARYCDKHIYCFDIQFKRTRARDVQKQGVDGYLTIDALGIHNAPTDEKAGAHYVNHPIKTYLMELSQITRDGKEVDGWFLNEESQTEYYMLMYLWAEVPQYEKNGKMVSEWDKIRTDNISLVEYYLVKKSDIFDYLESVGFSKERLRKGVEYLRTHPELNKIETKYGFKFVISRAFKECPVNICIEKRVYNKICKLHRYVSRFDYEKLTNLS